MVLVGDGRVSEASAGSAAGLLEPAALARLLGGRLPEAELTPATGVAYDSRRVRPGDAFFALRGSSAHGVAHADAALAAGAAFLVSDVPHPRPIVVDDSWRALQALASGARRVRRGPLVAGARGARPRRPVAAALPGRRRARLGRQDAREDAAHRRAGRAVDPRQPEHGAGPGGGARRRRARRRRPAAGRG